MTDSAALRTAPMLLSDRPHPRAWWVLALVAVPVFVGALDLTIVSAFLPEIIVSLELPIENIIDDAAWIVTGYLLAYTISMTFMGRVSDLIGRRRAFIISLIVFMVGSFVVAEVDPEAQYGIARLLYDIAFRIQGERPDPGNIALLTIVIGRVIQALGAGAIVPVSLALVGDLFPASRRAGPLGIIGAVDTLGWVLGHLYGGIMVRWFAASAEGFVAFFQSVGLNWGPLDWRALFWINLPIGAVALILTFFALRDVPQQRASGRFDWAGTILIAGALLTLVLGLGANIEVSSSAASFEDVGGFPPYAIPALIASALMFAGFIVVELRVKDPLLPIRLFARRSLAAGSLTNLFVGFCLMIGLVSVPILVNVRIADTSQLSVAALEVGILLSALTVPMALAAVVGGWLAERLGGRWIAVGGLALALVGFTLMWQGWTLEVANELVALHMILVGLGLGLTFSPISAAVINAADADRLGTASALVIIMRLLGMTLSVSLLTALASARLGYLAGLELGGQATFDAVAAINVYSRLTVQVLAEMGLVGAILCGVGLLPALLLDTEHGSRS